MAGAQGANKEDESALGFRLVQVPKAGDDAEPQWGDMARTGPAALAKFPSPRRAAAAAADPPPVGPGPAGLSQQSPSPGAAGDFSSLQPLLYHDPGSPTRTFAGAQRSGSDGASPARSGPTSRAPPAFGLGGAVPFSRPGSGTAAGAGAIAAGSSGLWPDRAAGPAPFAASLESVEAAASLGFGQ